MKRIIVMIGMALVSTMVLWNCADKDGTGSDSTLRESLRISSERLDKAIGEISSTPGYRIFSLGMNGSLKSTTADSVVYLDSILLDEIKGTYEYRKNDSIQHCHGCFASLFVKTGESDQLVVSLPEEKVFHPYRLYNRLQTDSALLNNFTINASDYHYYFNRGLIYDYKLSAGFELNNEDIGNLDILTTSSSWSDFAYHTAFNFNDNHSISLNRNSGDTANFSFALLEGTETLLSESVSYIKTGTSRHREREYHLTIGNIEITRNSDADSIQIYLDGVLQQNASVEFVDLSTDNDEGRVVCRKNRDMQITFDDGTVTTLSELIGPSMETLKNLSGSLQDMYFASYVVDYIAWNIYTGRIS
jgi:hypothetical protein